MSSLPGTLGPGGFLQSTLPSPPPSSAASMTNASNILPRPRATPLKPGSQKKSSLIDYVDNRLLAISRRYEKRLNVALDNGSAEDVEGRGYSDFGSMASDLEAVIDVIWVSGTPSLQIPYLLTVALRTCSCLPSFAFYPRPTFNLLSKLDFAFHSLLRGVDSETDETLPGFDGGRGKLSMTEKVRMRGIVERTRVVVVDVAGRGAIATYTESSAQITGDDLTTDDDDDDATMNGMEIDGHHGRWEMELARVYEKTIMELGTSLDTSGIGGLV